MLSESTSSSYEAGRFDRPMSFWKGTVALLAGMWDGFRLRCPSCSKERIYESGMTIRRECPACGAPFERGEEGDFIGAMLLVYSVVALLVLGGIVFLNAFTEFPLGTQIGISVPFSLLFVVAFYRNLKGAWVGILIPLVKWLR